MVVEDGRLKESEIAETPRMSTERVRNILHQHLGMEKRCARCVPRLLTVDQKLNRKTVSTENLALYKGNPSQFFRRFITVAETWVHHYILKSINNSQNNAVCEYFEGLDESDYKNGITAFEHRYEKCITFYRDYVAK